MTRTSQHKGQGRAVGTLGIILLLSVSALLVAGPSRRTDAAGLPAGQLVAQAAPSPAEPGASPQAPATPGHPAHTRGPAAQVESRIADLHKKLHITAAQEPQFKAFADVMRANADSMQTLFEQRAQHRDRTASGMLHWYAQLATAHAEGLNKLLPVFDTLYQGLSPKQQKAADAAFLPLAQARPRRKAG